MPIYEYRCSACGHQQEFLQKVSDAPVKVCTACGKETFNKMLSAAGFQLKGSGWYATDFKNKGSAPAKPAADSKADSKSTDSKGESKSGGDSKSGGEGKTESKPAAGDPPSGSGGKSASPHSGSGASAACS